MTIQELRQQAADVHAKAVKIQSDADEKRRALTDDEADQIEALNGDFEVIMADIDRRTRIEAQAAKLATPEQRKSDPIDPQNAGAAQYGDGARATHNSTRDHKRHGFGHFGEFLNAVQKVGVGRGADERLIANASLTTYGSEGTGADGGFAIPPEWRAQIMELVDGEGSILGLTDRQTISGNTITYPVDETSAWDSTNGIQVYWSKEAGTYSQSKPKLQPLTLRLEKLTALVPVTDEMLEDAPSMGNYVSNKAGAKLQFKINDAIINGDGAGMPLGMVNAGCKVQVAKESSQAADTIVAANILKMYSRMPAAARSRAYWFINQDIEPQLLSINVTFKDIVGSAGIAAGAAAYLPPGGLSGSPYATLMGRPILPTEACGTLGDEGDIIFADPGSYLSVMKGGGIKSDVSIHLWFDQGATAFRFTTRMDGRPWLSTAITRRNGSNTLSTVVTLQAR